MSELKQKVDPNKTFTVALIGGDGAGKGTISDRLMADFPLALRYLYMGINIESSNVALPTSRFIEKYKKSSGKEGYKPPVNGTMTAHPAKRKKKNPIWTSLRLVNRVAEEWYRQMLSRKARKNGEIVLYDRYFTFDFARSPLETDEMYKQRPFDDRLHRWLLKNTYPEADVVILLWAPAEVLFARKGEASVEYLEELMSTFIKKGESHPHFIKVDTRSGPDETYREVSEHIMNYYEKRAKKRSIGQS